MELPNARELAWFDKVGHPRPSHEQHGVTDSEDSPLSDKLSKGNPRNWELRGNILHCDTDFGPLAQAIPTDYILTGTDEKGLPVFKKIV